jgi:Protein of unknown function (DUF2510)
MTSTTGVPAGWYRDPQATFLRLRYWNGNSWTEHVAPSVDVDPSVAGHDCVWRTPLSSAYQGSVAGSGESPSEVVHWLLPTGRSWQSIAAGYIGLVSLVVFILGPVAVVLGILGLRAAGRQGSHGRGRSVFGIVTGCLGTLFGLMLVINGVAKASPVTCSAQGIELTARDPAVAST